MAKCKAYGIGGEGVKPFGLLKPPSGRLERLAYTRLGDTAIDVRVVTVPQEVSGI